MAILYPVLKNSHCTVKFNETAAMILMENHHTHNGMFYIKPLLADCIFLPCINKFLSTAERITASFTNWTTMYEVLYSVKEDNGTLARTVPNAVMYSRIIAYREYMTANNILIGRPARPDTSTEKHNNKIMLTELARQLKMLDENIKKIRGQHTARTPIMYMLGNSQLQLLQKQYDYIFDNFLNLYYETYPNNRSRPAATGKSYYAQFYATAK